MNIIKQTSTVHTTAYKNRNLQYIVIHYTAGVSSKKGSALNTAKYFAIPTSKGGRDASADFIIDDETIIQYNPDIKNRYTWHCGGKLQGAKGGTWYNIAFNRNTIGIEVCSTNKTGKVTNPNDANWSYTDKVLANTKELVEYLMKTYNIPKDNVIRHYDVTGKSCPAIIGWNGYTKDESKWNNFKKSIGGLVESENVKEAQNMASYIVEIKAQGTNLREAPSTSSKVIQILNKGDRLKIIGIKGNWLQTNWNRWVHVSCTRVV